MKKFASVLLAVLVAISMFSFVVSAADPTLTVSADKSAVKVGDTVKVTVKLAENSGLGALTFEVNYDATAFEAVSMTTDIEGAVANPKHNVTGKPTVATAVSGTITKAGTATLELKAIAATEKADFTITVKEACDGDFNAVTVATTSASVKVEAAEPPTDPTPSECTHETMTTWAQTKAPTCSEAGVKERSCTVCGETEKEAIPATGKCTYKWVVTKEATAKEYGEKQLKCTMCGDVKETQKLAVKEDTLTNPAIPNTDAIV